MNRRNWQALGALVGLLLVCLVLQHTGIDRVWYALLSASAYFPLILLFEFGFWFFGMLSQRALYGDERHLIPWPAVFRAGCVAYAIMGLMPMGRVVAESARAVLLSKHVGKTKAALVAVQVQMVALFVTGFVALLAALILISQLGFLLLTWAALINALAALALGMLALLAAKRFKIGHKLTALLPKVKIFGEQFDAYFINTRVLPKWPLIFEGLSRSLQVVQNGFLVLAVGGAFGIIPAFCSEAMHLIGATLGDLVPGQLGVTELVYGQAGLVLNLSPENALSIALLAHLAQLFWVVISLLIPIWFFKADDHAQKI